MVISSRFPSNHTQNLTTSQYFPYSHPSLSLNVLTLKSSQKLPTIFSAFTLASLTVIPHPAARELFKNHKSGHATFLPITHSDFSSAAKSQFLTSATRLCTAGSLCLLLQGLPSPFHSATTSTPASGPLYLLPPPEGISLDSSFDSNVTASKRPP